MAVSTNNTKQALHDATIDYVSKYGFQSCTVRKICEYANIHHSTFYKYYDDFSALLDDIENTYLDELFNVIIVDKQSKLDNNSTLHFVRFIKQRPMYYYVLTKCHAFREKYFKLIHHGFKENFYNNTVDEDAHFVTQYIFIGCMALTNEWINNGLKEPEEHIAQLLYELTASVVRRYLEHLNKE